MKEKPIFNNSYSLLFTFFLGLAIFLSSCTVQDSYDERYQELEDEVLSFYTHDSDSIKRKAVNYLVRHMPYHYSCNQLISVNDSLVQWRKETDSLLAKKILKSDTLATSILNERNGKHSSLFNPFYTDETTYADIELVDAQFLHRHIDNAFCVWSNSPTARHLKFEEFCEYILPYTGLNGFGFLHDGEYYNQWMNKFLWSAGTTGACRAIENYNDLIADMRRAGGNVEGPVNKRDIYDLYAYASNDCIGHATYACNILRACGLPVRLEFNAGFKSFVGRHYHLSLLDKNKRWQPFNAEGTIPGTEDKGYEVTLNMYAQTYAPNKQTPSFLKNKDEYIPPIFSNPCIIDVTENYLPCFTVSLPKPKDKRSNLTYLAAFNRSECQALQPSTWAAAESNKDNVTFHKVIPKILYFPICYNKQEAVSFAEPFYLDSLGCKHTLSQMMRTPKHTYDSVTVVRKYPRKKSMIEVAQHLVGGTFLGANKKDFSDAVELYTIQTAPQPEFTEYTIPHPGRYRYYRFLPPKEYPNTNISMMEWITLTKYHYSNTMLPTRVHLTSPAAVTQFIEDTTHVKLFNEGSWQTMTRHAWYDGKMHTAPIPYSHFDFKLDEPRIVTHLRFAPLSADNGIHSGQCYELYYWDNGWHLQERKTARYEHLVFHNMQSNRLYWLKNLDEGREEEPFFLIDGHQVFVYGDVIDFEAKDNYILNIQTGLSSSGRNK